MTWRTDEQDGSLAMTVRLPAEQGQVLVQALRAAAADLDHPHDHDPGPAAGVSAETPATGPDRQDGASPDAGSLADALAGIAADYLAGKITAATNPDLYQVIVHVGPEALTATDPDPALPPTADITTTHHARITPQTINAPGDRLDLHLAIWAAFANARIIAERAD